MGKNQESTMSFASIAANNLIVFLVFTCHCFMLLAYAHSVYLLSCGNVAKNLYGVI